MGLKVSIVIKEGKNKNDLFTITKRETIIGRKEADIIIDDGKISKKHSKLTISGRRVEIEDLNSTNGTYLNGERIKKAPLKNLDEITIGSTKLSVMIVEDIVSFKKRVMQEAGEKTENKHGKENIEAMIESELERFSPWDLAESESHISKKSEKKSYYLERCDLKLMKAGQSYQILKKNMVIGRGEVEIKIEDQDLSRKHASIEIDPSFDIYIRDLASTNGTFVNGKKISYTRLTNNDIIEVGGARLKFVVKVV